MLKSSGRSGDRASTKAFFLFFSGQLCAVFAASETWSFALLGTKLARAFACLSAVGRRFCRAVCRQFQRNGGLRERMADKALAALKSLWSKLPIKAPWKVCRTVFAHTLEPCPVCAGPLFVKVVRCGWLCPVL